MIENDMQSDFECVANELCVSPQLPPLEAMTTFESLDPSWMTPDDGPLSNSDLDAIDVGLMVNPQTGLPISLSSSLNSITTTSTLLNGGLRDGFRESLHQPHNNGSSTTTTIKLSGDSMMGNSNTPLKSHHISSHHHHSQQQQHSTSTTINSPTITINTSNNHKTFTTATIRDGIVSSSNATTKSNGFTLITTTTTSSPQGGQASLTIGNNSTSAATPIMVSSQQNPMSVVTTPQPLTASNVQALLGQSGHTIDQTTLSQPPAAKRSRLAGTEDIDLMSPSGKVFPKPAYSYSCLIAMALKNSKTGSLPVNEIYNFMIENFPYFKTAPNGWKNSVRHNLSLNKCFEKIEKPTTGPNGAQRKGCLWAMNPSKIGKMDEEVQKWSKKDPAAIRRSMAKPERLELLEKGYLKDLYGGSGGGGDSVDDEDEENEDSSDLDNEIDSMLPDTPPTSQDEAGSIKVKLIDSVLSEKFETSPWDTWDTLQQQDENKADTNVVISTTGIKGKPTIVTAAASATLCATNTPHTYIFTPTGNGLTGTITSAGSIKIEPKSESEFDLIR